MGRYVETGSATGKVAWIEDNLNGLQIEETLASQLISDPAAAIICVFDNGPFEAAMFVDTEEEFNRITAAQATDVRPRTYLLCPDREAVMAAVSAGLAGVSSV